MADELVDVYDENMVKTGEALKSIAHRDGLWHCSIHCWIVRQTDGAGYVLFQKRGADKDLYPNTLDISAAGHYQAGELPEQGVREILEELGLTVDFADLIPLGIKIDIGKFEGITNHEFCRTFLLRENQPPSAYKPDATEVEGLVEVSIRDGLALFSGERASVPAGGIEWDASRRAWNDIAMEVSIDSFIPRVDSYYYKIFIMADRMLQGIPYISI